MDPDELAEYTESIKALIYGDAHEDPRIQSLIEGAYMYGYEDGFQAGYTMGATE